VRRRCPVCDEFWPLLGHVRNATCDIPGNVLRIISVLTVQARFGSGALSVNGGQSGGPGYPPPDGGQPGWGDTRPYGTTEPQSGVQPYGGTYRGPGPQGPPTARDWSYGAVPPPPKNRTGLMIALAAAGAVVVLGGTAVAIGLSSGGGAKPVAATTSPAAPTPVPTPSVTPSPTFPAADGVPHSIVVPSEFDDYHRLTGSVADRLIESMRKSAGSEGGTYAEAVNKSKVAIFTRNGDDTQRLIFVGVSGNDSPVIAAELRSRTPSEEVDSTFLGMGITDTKDFPAGPLGGVLRCGNGTVSGGTKAAACAWADSSTVGSLLTPAGIELEDLAHTTLDLRSAAEQ
jgi:hypothetical protein